MNSRAFWNQESLWKLLKNKLWKPYLQMVHTNPTTSQYGIEVYLGCHNHRFYVTFQISWGVPSRINCFLWLMWVSITIIEYKRTCSSVKFRICIWHTLMLTDFSLHRTINSKYIHGSSTIYNVESTKHQQKSADETRTHPSIAHYH